MEFNLGTVIQSPLHTFSNSGLNTGPGIMPGARDQKLSFQGLRSSLSSPRGFLLPVLPLGSQQRTHSSPLKMRFLLHHLCPPILKPPFSWVHKNMREKKKGRSNQSILSRMYPTLHGEKEFNSIFHHISSWRVCMWMRSLIPGYTYMGRYLHYIFITGKKKKHNSLQKKRPSPP